eukprot:Nitzschia sp. Nitz4//scaffold52_size167869//153583//154464//NITZ4_002297-RA/size167869-processed-gene-0.139-mRNA-1//-1//CDS//3329554098//1580//frame0
MMVSPHDASPTVHSSSNSTSLSTTSTPIRNTINKGIFQFNKNLIDTLYKIMCILYPVKGNDRDFVRFYILETVARVPYFAYLSVMHLRETFGVRFESMSDRMRTHYAEADNELHHLLIMESLGGNSSCVDRTLAQTAAFFYYWYVVVIYMWDEAAAYHLSELIEDHAYETYDAFLKEHADRLKTMPVPEIARQYYEVGNPCFFDQFSTVPSKEENRNRLTGHRIRPPLQSLYDVFVLVRDDEKEHWRTLCNLVQFQEMNAVNATQVQATEPNPKPYPMYFDWPKLELPKLSWA